MRLEKIDLNLFVVLDAIYIERNLTRVANTLNITQPAVSNALSRLRQTFDDPLFVRSPDGMAPTPLTDSIIADVRKALSLLGKSVDSGKGFDPYLAQQHFNLGMNDLAEALILPSLQRRLERLAPNISISSYYVDRKNATEELKSGGLDLLLDTPAVNAKELGQLNLGQLPYAVCMSASNPGTRRTFTFDDYLKGEHIHVSSRRKGRGQMDIALQALGQKRQIRMRVQNYLVAARITAETELLWTVPRALAKTTDLHCVDLPFAMEPLIWNLYWHKSAEDDPRNRWLRSIMAEVVHDLLPSISVQSN